MCWICSRASASRAEKMGDGAGTSAAAPGLAPPGVVVVFFDTVVVPPRCRDKPGSDWVHSRRCHRLFAISTLFEISSPPSELRTNDERRTTQDWMTGDD